ncbi:hypothetical protein SLEP1_g23294 [Rubroshorea leprosula]|uniref:Uncharacterized protein n=1 Tax=Rubroshorea leprosula TaxID=152421 RepID=A0AAV5JBW1_9ROSI|nr:hypothetical protein SLEP1_g23294 [Rubroshorea leprosula]
MVRWCDAGGRMPHAQLSTGDETAGFPEQHVCSR